MECHVTAKEDSKIHGMSSPPIPDHQFRRVKCDNMPSADSQFTVPLKVLPAEPRGESSAQPSEQISTAVSFTNKHLTPQVPSKKRARI